ncbi:MAG: hypothetical protein DHS20C13_09760 [Thermodesulfobacteriota bacterium]|nr:MAG: hypothetical protein DHS20C13_09760 [Thermodesulfobacteriota bacterium]
MLNDNKEFELQRIIKDDAAHKSVHLDYIGETFLGLILELINVDMASIYIVSEDRKEAVLRAYRNLSTDYIKKASKIPFPKGITWKLIKTGRLINKHDIQKDKDLVPAEKKLGNCGALGVPIALKDNLVEGVIWLFRHEKRKFSEQEIKITLSIAQTIGMAISKSRIFDEVYDRVRTLTSKLEKDNQLLKQEIEDRKRNEREIRTVREQQEVLNALKEILKNFQNMDTSHNENLAQDEEHKKKNLDKSLHEKLSKREYKVMLMITSGMSMKDMAAEMYVSISTISTYRARLIEKLGLKTNAEVIRYAIKHKLID